MGCEQSSPAVGGTAGQPVEEQKKSDVLTKVGIDRAWRTANVQAARSKRSEPPVVQRSTWKTVRIFVSSTFKDFDSEREILVKKVFPDLRTWCLSRRLHLIECDLRWGIPLGSPAEAPLRACLGEIDRCSTENVFPFFINMTSERSGWIPAGDEIPGWIKTKYSWIEGLSVTEMEIMCAAYRNDNPNALFLVRESSFLDTVPEPYQSYFLDSNPVAPYKQETLKKMLQRRCQATHSQMARYQCSFDEVDPVTNWPRLGRLDDFAKTVFAFFKARIAAQYPLPQKKVKLKPHQEVKQQHETFMKLEAQQAVDRDNIIGKLIKDHIESSTEPNSVLIGGPAGIGKTTVMCALANACISRASKGQLPKPTNSNKWRVFCHFTGALTSSTELLPMLNRMIIELQILSPSAKLPTDLEEAMGLVRGALSKETTKDCIVVIDAIDHFDAGMGLVAPIAWLPTKLTNNVRVFVSANSESLHYKRIQRDFSSGWTVVELQPLDRQTKEKLGTSHLERFNKRLDSSQVELLLNKKSSGNPLWLSLAAEELRLFGFVRQLTSKISSLPDDLLSLEEQILARFERDTDAVLLVATLCLLECSSKGLLESEIVEILASPNLIPKQLHDHLFDINVNVELPKDLVNEREQVRRITANRWADVYRCLQPFLLPYGSSGDSNLEFYYRSLSYCVRRRYFPDKQNNEIKRHFHRLLADYFSYPKCVDLERQVEEYPSAAFRCGELDGLKSFLSDLNVFDEMYDEDFSRGLSKSWAFVHELEEQSGGHQTGNVYETMQQTYLDIVEKICSKSLADSLPLSERLERIARILMQNRCCEAGASVADRLVSLSKPPEGADSSPEMQKQYANSLFLKAIIIDEDLRVHDYFFRTHKPGYDPKEVLPRLIDLVDLYQNAIAIFRQHAPNDLRLGQCLNGVAFVCSGISSRGGCEDLAKDSARSQAISHVEEAIKLYSAMPDSSLNVADCLVTRGICESEPTPKQLDFFEQAQRLIFEKFGPFHTLLLRVYFNTGIYYQELGNGDETFRWFQKWYQLLEDVFGGHHPRTVRAKQFVSEANFRKIAEENLRRKTILTDPSMLRNV